MLREPRTDQRCGRLAQFDGRGDEIDSAKSAVAVFLDIVANDGAAIGPADQDGFCERELFDDRGDVVGPFFAVGVLLPLHGRVRNAVAAQVEGNDAEPLGEIAFILPRPREMTLRPAVNEEKRDAVRISPFANMELDPASADHAVDLNRILPFEVLWKKCGLLNDDWRERGGIGKGP